MSVLGWISTVAYFFRAFYARKFYAGDYNGDNVWKVARKRKRLKVARKRKRLNVAQLLV